MLCVAAGENVSRNCKRTNIYVCLICLSDADDNRCTRTNRASDLYISCTNSKTRTKSQLEGGEGGEGREEEKEKKEEEEAIRFVYVNLFNIEYIYIPNESAY